jgi:Plasma-membrane choline transporter
MYVISMRRLSQYGFNTPQGVPRHAALGSFRRCMTYSFGSLAFGSLIVSIIQFLKQLASLGQAAAQQEGDTIFQLIFCCLQCLSGIIESLVQYFNHYAYTQVALYGKVHRGLYSANLEILDCCPRYLAVI